MPIFTRTFTFETDAMGTTGLIPEFLPGVDEEYLAACVRSKDVAHDIIEHWSNPCEGDAITELAAVGAYAVGRWGFTATSGNMADAISGDVQFILSTDALRGAAMPHAEPIEQWVRDGVRAGIRELVAELRDDDDATEQAISIIRDRRQIESAIQHGAERCVNVYGSSDFAYEAFQNVEAAFDSLDLDEMGEGDSVTFTVDTDTREATVKVMGTCWACGDDVELGAECCE